MVRTRGLPDVSICLPYFERPRALARFLRECSEDYCGGGVEVVVADDGSIDHPAAEVVHEVEPRIEVRVVELPRKRERKNPCVPFNRAVAQARADLIVLTHAEMSHDPQRPGEALWSLFAALPVGTKRYCYPRVWDTREGTWKVRGPDWRPTPYFSLMHKSDFLSFGGYDESYRDGYAFDDDDLVQRMVRAGIELYFVASAVVVHDPIHEDEATGHIDEEFNRNWRLFELKWPGVEERYRGLCAMQRPRP